MRSSADENVISSHVFAFDLIHLLNERFRIYHYSVCNDTFPFALKNSRWKKVQNEFLISYINRVTSIVPSLETYNVI